MSDLVERLGDLRKSMESWNSDADLIAEAAARIAALEEGLRWYASREAWTVDEVEGPNGDYGGRARALLGGSNGE